MSENEIGDALRRAYRSMADSIGWTPAGEIKIEIEEDGGHGAPVTPRAGVLTLSPEVAEALADPEGDGFDAAVQAAAHGMAHLLGEGPAFADLGDQLLEEALAEIIGQGLVADVARELGGETEDLGSIVEPAASAHDIVVVRPVAALVSVERFMRLAAWLARLEEEEEDAIEATALRQAAALKPLRPEARRALLAQQAIKRAVADSDEEIAADAGATFAEYLDGYFKQLQPSAHGFAALDAALEHAAYGERMNPTPQIVEREPWATTQIEAEAVTLDPRSDFRAIEKALDSLDGDSAEAARRSLDARSLLWSARTASPLA